MIPHQVPSCLVLHLKEIEIRNIVGENHELEAVEYLLRHAEVLKKMTIYCHEPSLGKEFCACKKLFGFWKGSTSCKLTVFCSCWDIPPFCWECYFFFLLCFFPLSAVFIYFIRYILCIALCKLPKESSFLMVNFCKLPF